MELKMINNVSFWVVEKNRFNAREEIHREIAGEVISQISQQIVDIVASRTGSSLAWITFDTMMEELP
jgi:hypothetical protein